MLAIYHVILLVLSTVKALFARRANSLERKFVKLAQEVSALCRHPLLREGNSAKFDPQHHAKRQFELGALVQRKDQLEATHFVWARRVERISRLVMRLQGWKGRLVPYGLGALDAFLVRSLVEYVTSGELVTLGHYLDMVLALIQA